LVKNLVQTLTFIFTYETLTGSHTWSISPEQAHTSCVKKETSSILYITFTNSTVIFGKQHRECNAKLPTQLLIAWHIKMLLLYPAKWNVWYFTPQHQCESSARKQNDL